jgi:hypothetical protein
MSDSGIGNVNEEVVVLEHVRLERPYSSPEPRALRLFEIRRHLHTAISTAARVTYTHGATTAECVGRIDELKPDRRDVMTTRMRVLTVVALALCGSGCALSRSVRQNTDAIGGSTSAIAGNTEAIRASTAATGNLVPALQGVERLRGPMESVAALDPTLRGVAALREPMGSVAALDPSMRALAALGTPMTQLVAIRPGLEATAALGPSMDRLAGMRPSLEAVAGLHQSLDRVASLDQELASVAGLKGSMDQLGQLREPMQRLAALEAPMARVAAFGSVLTVFNRPWLLVLIGLVALGAWGGVTFVAVKLAIVSAARVTRTQP